DLLLLTSPLSPLFPYTTLFRSHRLALHDVARELIVVVACELAGVRIERVAKVRRATEAVIDIRHPVCAETGARLRIVGGVKRQRSEEHTSELQSPDHLVCRLLL